MQLAEVEYRRLLDVVDSLEGADWHRATDCTAWDLRSLLGHVLGMLELLADREEAQRQLGSAAEIADRVGGARIDALTALQVDEHAHLSPDEISSRLHATVPRALRSRRGTTEQDRSAPYPTGLPGERVWSRGYLLDVIHTRDPWIHRIDVCRATGRQRVLTADHDGRIVADVVSEWASRHEQPFTLILDGAAGGRFSAGAGGPALRLDAVEFCRVLSGRGAGEGLLATRVPF